ncbi:MAG TPA: YdcF family protein [Candidatus Acidoferrales bacterium]|nr:YdcF family protein [Candidatus Acidoferrales bacterium]
MGQAFSRSSDPEASAAPPPRIFRNPERGGLLTRLALLIVLAAFFFGLYLFRVPILQAAGRFWIVDDSPGPADAIMILGDDNFQGDRATRAAELFRAHWAPRVVASGRPLRPYISVPDLMRRDLEQRGVPDSAIVSYPRPVANTREEAEGLRKLAIERGWRHVLIVTSTYHTRRTHFIFARVWPKEYEFRVISAHDSEYDPDSWWRTREGLKLVFHETVGIVVAAWELRHAE